MVWCMIRTEKFPSVYGVYRNYDEVSKFPYGNLKVNIRNI